MRWVLSLSILVFSVLAHGKELGSAVMSVGISSGLTYDASQEKIFSTIEAAQNFATASNLNEITLRLNLRLAATDCGYDIPALSLGYVYDQDRALFNGQIIGSTGNPDLSKRRLSLLPRVYPIPVQNLKCPGDNILDLSLKRILGGWIGPFAGKIELGELHELQQKAMLTEAWGPLFQRDIGVLLLAITILLISLFYRYPDNHRQSAFVVFSLSIALLCLSLSGWYYRYFDFPYIIFRLHFALVSLGLSTQILFVSAYREMKWAKFVSKRLFFVSSFVIFAVMSFSIGSAKTLLDIYLYQLLFLISISWGIYLLPLLMPQKFGSRQNLSLGIEFALFLIHFGATADIARIWKLHNFENISPYTYGLSVFLIGSILASELVQVFQKAAQAANAEAELRQSRAQTEFARQVGHDIRSPLAALNMVVGMMKDVPEERRLIIRNATQRINDIANNLLDRGKSKNLSTSMDVKTDAASSQVVMLSSLVDSIVSEKRVQYRERQDIDIQVDLSESYGLFSQVDAQAFARALSNLIDNSVEAFGTGAGNVLVTMMPKDSFNRIIVSDNGNGISPEILEQLGTMGVSFGKNSGSGLGLYQARSAVKSAGGSLSISSEVGRGTSVTLDLPKVSVPSWFIGRLEVSAGTEFVSVDDDQTVHQIWRNRLRGILSIKHRAFTSISQFEEWYKANASSSFKLAMDFEFLGQSESGLQAIERMNLGHKAMLVSSRAEDHNIQLKASMLGLKVLPKALAPLVPIEIL